MSVKNTLFDYHELKGLHHKSVQFRFIGEEVGIQPKTTTNFCVPQEINEFYQISNNLSTIDMIQTVSTEELSTNVTSNNFDYV